MPTDPASSKPPAAGPAKNQGPGKPPPTPQAERALAEAAARRAAEDGKKPAPEPEAGGRGGPEPTRYGDWEINGLISDF